MEENMGNDSMSDMPNERIKVRRARRKVYGRDFKLQMVRRVTQGISPAQLRQEFGVSSSMVAKWICEWRKDPAHAFRGYGRRRPFEEQVERLRREVRKLRAEKNLLKKASARLAVNPDEPSGSLQNIERSGRLDGCARYSMSRAADTTIG